jgi:hypothetical protein
VNKLKRVAMRGATALALASAFGLAGLVVTAPLLAQDAEACSVSINSSPANDVTVELAKDDGVSIKVFAPEDSVRNDVYLKLFGRRVKISEIEGSGGQFQSTATLSEVGAWGVGLFEIVWESLDSQGTVLCTATTRLRILGSPFGSVTGVAGAAAMTIGLSSLAFTLRTTINAGARWAIKAVTGAKVERRGDDEPGRRIRIKPSLSVTQTLTSTIAGFLAGGGTLITLQQAALSPPTLELALKLVLPFALLGLLTGIFARRKDEPAA